MPARDSSSAALAVAADRDTDRSWTRIASATCQPTVNDGLSAVIGSWNTMAIWEPRSFLRWAADSSRRDVPPTLMSPVHAAVGGSSPMAAIAVIDLPDPDSPTIATISPGETDSDTPSTARAAPNDTTRSLMSSADSGICTVSGTGHRSRSRTSNASRSPSPMKLNAHTTITIAMPAGMIIHQ